MGRPPRDPDPDLVEAFWTDARIRARLNPTGAVSGPTVSDSVLPPAWSLGGDVGTADALVDLILSGHKTATSSALRDYGEEPLPRPGDLGIVCDGSGRPRALIRTTAVRTAPFGEVDAEHAFREGEGDRSLSHWRRTHRDFFTATARNDEPVTEDLAVVLETFEVLVPAEAGRRARRLLRERRGPERP